MRALIVALLALTAVVSASGVISAASAETATPVADLLDVDENEISPESATVLETTTDALSPADQETLSEMLKDSEGIELVNEQGESIDQELDQEERALEDAAKEEAEESAEEQSIRDGAHDLQEVSLSQGEEDEEEEEEEEEEEDASFLQVADEDEEEEAEEEEEEEVEEEAEYPVLLQVDEEEEEQEEEGEETSELQSSAEAEAHLMLQSIANDAAVFLEVADSAIEHNGEQEQEEEQDSDEADDAALAGEVEVSDSDENVEQTDQNADGDSLSDSDPYFSFIQSESDTSSLVDAPLNAVTSTHETTEQLGATEETAASRAEVVHAAANEDLSEEMEVDEMGEGVWDELKAVENTPAVF